MLIIIIVKSLIVLTCKSSLHLVLLTTFSLENRSFIFSLFMSHNFFIVCWIFCVKKKAVETEVNSISTCKRTHLFFLSGDQSLGVAEEFPASPLLSGGFYFLSKVLDLFLELPQMWQDFLALLQWLAAFASYERKFWRRERDFMSVHHQGTLPSSSLLQTFLMRT